jgi:formylmethanofuran dehydrogenase subunit E
MAGAVEYILMCEQCYDLFYDADGSKIICKMCVKDD